MKISFTKDEWSMQDWMIVKYPGLVIACEPDTSGEVPVFQERYEVVIYDRGIFLLKTL